MNKNIQIIGVEREEEDISLFVRALIGLARQIQEEEKGPTAARNEQTAQAEPR